MDLFLYLEVVGRTVISYFFIMCIFKILKKLIIQYDIKVRDKKKNHNY